MRNCPCILHCKTFSNISPTVHRSRSLISYRGKRSTPITLAVTTTHILRFRVDQSLIRKRTIQKILIIVHLAQSFGSLCDTIVVIGIFQCFGNRLRLFVKRDVAIPHIVGQTVVMFVQGSRFHRLIRPFVVETFHSFDDHIRQDGDRMIADHAPSLVSVKRPDREHFLHALVKVGQHRIGDVGIYVLMH